MVAKRGLVGIKFQNIGWKSKVMQKRASFNICINKMVAVGCCLEKGQELYCYLAENDGGRPIMLVYLDGKEKEKNLNITKTLKKEVKKL